MPATYAVVQKVLQEVRRRFSDRVFSSLLDLGSGPGTVLWAAGEEDENLETITCYEQDKELILLGQNLAQQSDKDVVRQAAWHSVDLMGEAAFPENDLVVLSYVLGEFPSNQVEALIEKSWKAAKKGLVIIEPGTPHGFDRILQARTKLIQLGSYLAAPCPHEQACPLASGNPWCHFSERLERSSDHRKIKGASLGFEDEKYSYLAVSRTPLPSIQGRIIGHPQKHSGHLEMTLCTVEGIQKKKWSKKDGADYKNAKKLEWGDKV
jgi:ribosomal protein RSM22 (predicted rRNA methylase)